MYQGSFGWSVPVHGPHRPLRFTGKKLGPEKSEALVGKIKMFGLCLHQTEMVSIHKDSVTCLTHVRGSVAGTQFVSLLKRQDDEAKLVIPLSVTREQCYSVSRPMNTPDLTGVPLLFTSQWFNVTVVHVKNGAVCTEESILKLR